MSDLLSTGGTAPDALQAGRDALVRHAWVEAFAQLSLADREGRLSGADLESLALASFFGAHADGELAVKERAFKAHESEGNALRAAYLAIDIARAYGYAGKYSLASAWKGRAERIVGTSGESYVHGYLALAGSEAAGAMGDVDAALALAERAVAIGNSAADADLTAYALTCDHRAQVQVAALIAWRRSGWRSASRWRPAPRSGVRRRSG